MAVKTLEVGQLACNCYIVSPDQPKGENRPCVVVDPGDEADRISSEIRSLGLRLEAILLTHAHVDHIGGVAGLLAQWPEAVLACSAETSRRAGDPRLNLSVFMNDAVTAPAATRFLADGETFTAAWLEWRAVEVPGHDPGEMVYIIADGQIAFTGDTVFSGSIGRSDFPGGDGEQLIRGVRALLESLPPGGLLFPGHGPATQVRTELDHNPFLRRH